MSSVTKYRYAHYAQYIMDYMKEQGEEKTVPLSH